MKGNKMKPNKQKTENSELISEMKTLLNLLRKKQKSMQELANMVLTVFRLGMPKGKGRPIKVTPKMMEYKKRIEVGRSQYSRGWVNLSEHRVDGIIDMIHKLENMIETIEYYSELDDQLQPVYDEVKKDGLLD